MANPLIALVGRPNVGKSTFFNKVAGRKISITEDRPGVTRDRLYVDATWRGRSFTMVDTGGIELKSEDVMWKEIAKQAEVAIDTADVIHKNGIFQEGLCNKFGAQRIAGHKDGFCKISGLCRNVGSRGLEFHKGSSCY